MSYIYWPILLRGHFIRFNNTFVANLASAVQLMPMHCCVHPPNPQQNAQSMSFVQISLPTLSSNLLIQSTALLHTEPAIAQAASCHELAILLSFLNQPMQTALRLSLWRSHLP